MASPCTAMDVACSNAMRILSCCTIAPSFCGRCTQVHHEAKVSAITPSSRRHEAHQTALVSSDMRAVSTLQGHEAESVLKIRASAKSVFCSRQGRHERLVILTPSSLKYYVTHNEKSI